MQTGSVVIKKITAFLAWLNYYFEYSLIYRGFAAIGKAAKGSRIIAWFLNRDYRDYWQGSLILRFIAFVSSGVLMGARWVFRKIAKANENSLNKKIFLFIVKPRKYKIISECAPVRLVRWYFGSETEAAAKVDFFEIAKVIYMLFIVGALIVPDAMWNNMLLLLSAVFFAFVYAIKWFLSESDEKPKFSHISPALVLFVFFCALSIFTGYGGTDSLRVYIIFFACVMHSVLVALFFNEKKDVRLFFLLISVTFVITALYGFYLYTAGIEIRTEFTDLTMNPGLSRLYSVMGNSNNDAQAWAMLLPFVIAVAITVKDDRKRIILAGAILLVLGAFAMTYARAGYIAFVAGMGVFVLMTAPRLVPIAFLFLIVALPFIPASILERLFTLGQDSSSQYRFLIWGGVGRMLEDFWVRGIGMGPAAFIRIYRGYAHPLAERAMHSHNTFLDILSHSGIGALLTFVAYLFGLFRRGISAHAASADREYKIYMAAGIAALTVFFVFGAGEYVWFYPRVMLVFWVVAGLILGMAGMKQNES